jgi:SAM-dependent methyltransferase
MQEIMPIHFDREVEDMFCFCGERLVALEQFGVRGVKRWHKGEVPAYACSRCSYVGFQPPSEEDLNHYYRADYGSGNENYYTYDTDHEPQRVVERSGLALSLARTYFDESFSGVIVELGCAYGGAVLELRRQGHIAYGLDLNSRAISEGQSRGNAFLYDLTPNEFAKSVGIKADFIYSFHMLEHVPDLKSYLKSVNLLLNDGGVVMFRVPNGAYLRAWLQGFTKWDWFAFPDHLHMLTPVSAAALVRKCGFELLGLRSNACGEKLDSIVSWLPEAAERGEAAIGLLEEAGCLSELEFVFRKAASTTSPVLASLNAEAVNFAHRSEALEAEIKIRPRILAQKILQPRSSLEFISRNENNCFINHQVLQYLKNLLPSGLDATVETGSGANAASFSALSNSHTVFATTSNSERPDSTPTNVTWVPGPTALSLPSFSAYRSYDLIYLEGADAYPVSEAEYLFLRPYLKPGGFLLLGNLHLSTLSRLADVIAEDERFRVEALIGNCAVFRRTDETLRPEAWRSNRYNRRRLSPSHPDYLPGRPLADIFSALRLDQAASAPKDLSRLALVDIGHFLGQTHPACSAVRARLGSLDVGSPTSTWLKILDDSGADLQDVQVPPVKPDGVLVALDVPADRIDLFFRLRLEQLLRASPALHEAAFILIAPPDAAAPRRGLPPAGFVSRAGSSWPFEKTFFACPDRAGAALLTNTLGVPVHYISPAHAEDIARALAEGRLPEQGLFRSGAAPGQRLAAQIQPMWGRCGSSTAFENELGALVAEGFFVLHLTVPDLSWAEFSPSLDANFRQRLTETTVNTAGHVAAYAGCAPEDRFIPNRTPDFAEAFAVEVVGRARLSVSDSLVAMGLAQASIVIVNHITNIPLAVTQSPHAAILLDVHDDFTRSGYEKSMLDPPLADPVRCADLRWMRKAETALWRLADVCTNVNEHENKRVARWNDASMLVLPRPYVGRIDTISPEEAEYDALIVADIHPFNIRSLEWFLEEVWQPNDAVRSLRIAVVGRACNAIDSQRYNHPNLHLLGFVEDLDALRQRCLVSLAPDRAGTGVAVKVLTALYAGHPLVGTSIAFRGFPPKVRAAVPVHDIPSAFAQDLLALVSEAGARRQRIAEGDLACKLLASAGFPAALRRALQHPRLNAVARKLATQGLLDALGPIHERLGGRRSPQVKVSLQKKENRNVAVQVLEAPYVAVEVPEAPYVAVQVLEAPFMKGWRLAGTLGHQMADLGAQLSFGPDDLPGRKAILQLAFHSDQPGSQIVLCSGGRVIGSGVLARAPVLITAPLPEQGADVGISVDLFCVPPPHAQQSSAQSAAILLNWNINLPPQLIGSRIDFASKAAEPLLREGWYAEGDGWGRWTSRRRAVVALPIPFDYQGGLLGLNMSIVPHAMTGRTVVRAGGKEIGQVSATGGELSAVIDEAYVRPGESLEIEICCDGTRQPTEEQGATDQRILGVGVARMSLAPIVLPEAPPEPTSARRVIRALRRRLSFS